METQIVSNEKITHCVICGNSLKSYQIKRGITTCCRSCAMKKMWQNNNSRTDRTASIQASNKKRSNSLKIYWSDETHRQKHSESLKQVYEDESLRQRLSKTQKTVQNKPEVKSKISSSIKQFYLENPEAKQRLSKSLKQAYEDESLRQKLSEAQKLRFQNAEERQKLSEAQKLRFQNAEERQKRSNIAKELWQNEDYRSKITESVSKALYRPETRQKLSNSISTAYNTYKNEILQKRYDTMKINNTFNSSSWETEAYNTLQQKFDKVFHQYKCDKYPYNCDFYIPSLDLFIELNFHWTHGHKSFDELDQSCLDQLNKWKEKAKTSKFYQNAIYTWTDLDVRKLKIFNEHKLNYKIFYTHKEFKEWFNTVKET